MNHLDPMVERERKGSRNETTATMSWSKVFFKDYNSILKYSIVGDNFGLKKHIYRSLGKY